MKKGFDYIGVTIGYIAHDGNGQYLMSKRSSQSYDERGTWDFGGGWIEFGELAEDCVKREVKEELGVDILNIEYLGYLDVFREKENKKHHIISLEFKVLVDRSLVVNNEPHKFEMIDWFNINALPKELPSFMNQYLLKFKHLL